MPRKPSFAFLLLFLLAALSAGCGSSPNNQCVISTATLPQSATADHTMVAPGDEVQFSLQSSAVGNCPLPPDFMGVWSTSDSVDISISNQAPTQGLATCLHATTTPATISNSSMVRGIKSYPSVTLTCK